MKTENPPGKTLVYCWDSRLRQRCRSVEPGESGLEALVRDMHKAMQDHDGVGLAAPQVGDLRRVLLVRRPDDPPARVQVMLNPELIEAGDAHSWFEEGCLSFPGIYRQVRRPRRIKLRYMEMSGREVRLEDDGILARIVQHELDHLDGILFSDHLSRWTRFWVNLRMVAWRMGFR